MSINRNRTENGMTERKGKLMKRINSQMFLFSIALPSKQRNVDENK
jgi:hypothetical protein